MKILPLLALAFPLVAQWPQVRWEKTISGLRQPTQVVSANDGSGRLFAVQLGGLIRIVREGAILETPFLDLSSRIGYDSERGLLSMAFPPQYSTSKRFYVNYTSEDGTVTISRFRVSASNPDVADPDSEQVVLRIEQPFGQHNGGMMAFGPLDGLLYISTGDGGIRVEENGDYTLDPLQSAQSLDTLLGKILRIDPEHGEKTYSIPPSNPFVGQGRGEIWARGLRNPWRFSFDRLTGDLYIGDVGHDLFEEINMEPGGGPGGNNYGWSMFEASHCVDGVDCSTAQDIAQPVFEYDHVEGCSVTGGIAYRGAKYPQLHGTYIFGDFCKGMIWAMKLGPSGWQTVKLGPSGALITSFGEDEDGEIYLVDYRGSLLRLAVDTGAITPTMVSNAASFEPGLSPGSLVTLETTSLASVTAVETYGDFPMPFTLAGISVWVDGAAVPLFSVVPKENAGQVTFLAPYYMSAESAQIQVRSGYDSSTMYTATVMQRQPGIFSADGKYVSAINEHGANSTGGRRGSVAAVFGTGFGEANNPPLFGMPAQARPYSAIRSSVSVTIGGRPAEVLQCGLTPGFAGTVELIFVIPSDVPEGDADIVVEVEGARSPALKFTVH